MPDEYRILVVDDEEIIAWAISQGLSRKGEMLVQTAQSGEEALEKLTVESFDLVITDLRMKGMTGIELLTNVRSLYPETGVVVMTAYGTPEAKKEASQRGSLYYLDKPFEMDELRSIVHEALQKIGKETAAAAVEEGFSGEISNLSLVDMVQLHCLARNSVMLDVHTGDKSGSIGFLDGEIVYASTSVGETGGDAVIEMLGWSGGDFETVDRRPEEENVQDSWESLLLEATDVIAAAAESATTESSGQSDEPGAGGDEQPPDMHELLEELSLEQGVMGVFVAGDTGVLIDQVVTTYSGDVEEISTLAKAMKDLRRLHIALEPGARQNRVVIQFDRARVVATEISDTAVYLIAVNSGVGSLGRLVQQLTRISNRLASLF